MDHTSQPTVTVSSDHLVVEVAELVGPRVLTLRRPDGDDLFVASDVVLDASTARGAAAPCRLFGGHRLWRAPEVPALTWTADDGPVDIEQSPRRVVVTGAPSPTGVRAIIDIELDADGPTARVRHRLVNEGAPTSLAPWALTMLRPGGTVLLPLDRAVTDDVGGVQSSASRIVLWPYTDLSDPAIGFTADTLTIETALSPGGSRNKVGVATRADWCAYLLDGTAFVKRSVPCESPVDGGAVRQTFWQPDFVELETLGPLVELASGESVEHEERWQLVDATALTREVL